ncbi:MAG: oxygen-independent coproporphyrinogen III oxidase [Bacteroidales bacterium]
MEISEKLLEKYNRPVPRYTSYPPANHFTDEIRGDKYLEMVQLSNSRQPSNIAVYIHIPFCHKICFYCGCNSCKLNKGDEYLEYHEALKKEIDIITGEIDDSRTVTQIHFGGGTPNSIPVRYLSEIIGMITSGFALADDAEIAIECNPALLDKDYVDKLKEAGFNRFSLGIQDFDQEVLRMVNRDSSALPVGELIEYIKKDNDNIAVNLDFIYGLPGQTADSFRRTMAVAAGLRPDRLVTFSYAHVPWLKKNQKILEKYDLPSARQKVDMFMEGYEILSKAGYMPVGLDHYVLPDDQLYRAVKENLLHRNFQGYCTRHTTGQVYAFGVSAISQLEMGYFQNTKSVKDYKEALQRSELPVEKGRILDDREKVVREVITQLMCNKYINWKTMGEITGAGAATVKSTVRLDNKALSGFAADGLLEFNDDNIRVTEKGSMFIRNIAASLDPAYQPEKNKYSKSV